MKSPLFILAGNGPYDNRGCEAIVRGTVKILRRSFDEPRFVVCSEFRNAEQKQRQITGETDPAIRHVGLRPLPSFKKFPLANRILWKGYSRFAQWRRNYLFQELTPFMGEAAAVLSIGGDNYTLDYGTLSNYIDLDYWAIGKNKKFFIWGASIGPFEQGSQQEAQMERHFKEMPSIFVRESLTRSYLKSIRVESNVHEMADPAFVLDPEKPERLDFEIEENRYIGINIQPLLGRFAGYPDLDSWSDYCAEMIRVVLGRLPDPVLLISHVSDVRLENDDPGFMRTVSKKVGSPRVRMVSNALNAAQTKWVISRCRAFVGGRTHATIASLSSAAPTLSLAYSQKAQGINRDIFGDLSYCLSVKELTGDRLADGLNLLLTRENQLRVHLERKTLEMQHRAYLGGELLARILESRSDRPSEAAS